MVYCNPLDNGKSIQAKYTINDFYTRRALLQTVYFRSKIKFTLFLIHLTDEKP